MIYKGVSESPFHFVIPEIKIPTQELIELYESLKEYDYPWNEYKRKYDPNKNHQPRGDGGLGSIFAPDKDGKDLIDYPLVQNILSKFNFPVVIKPRDISIMTYKPGFIFKKHTDTKCFKYNYGSKRKKITGLSKIQPRPDQRWDMLIENWQ